MTRQLPGCLILSLVLFSHPAVAEVDQSTGLKVAPGWELVRAHCIGCHSSKLITQQSGSRDEWLKTIRWMQDTQNLWQLDPAVESSILTYLSTNYPPRQRTRRKPIPEDLMPPS